MSKLDFKVKNGEIVLFGDGFSPIMREGAVGGDFWRIYLDYCEPEMNRELGVYSHAQTPVSVKDENGTAEICYDRLVAEDGSVHNVELTLYIKRDGDKLLFSAKIKNNGKARVNELQYPFFDFEKLNGSFSQDVLYIPNGLGYRGVDPHALAESAHTEYMAADYKNIWKSYNYPAPLSMPWMAVQSGKSCLYMGAHFEKAKIHSLNIGCEPREAKTDELLLCISSYPAVVNGEELTYGDFCAALTDDWRGGADVYREFIESSWFTPVPKKDSIRRLDGWQRIILKHQFGEIIHKYEDLPRIYAEGVKYGINMILLFAWWSEGMDNGYPNYEPDPALGGVEKLRAAIKEINDQGGRVVLYANGHLIDIATDFYKNEGWKYTMKDIDNNDYREHYKFSNNGTLLRYGNKSFANGCYGTEGWIRTLDEITRKHIDFGSNGTFFDQIACCMRHCFDTTHTHGNRIDEDPQYRHEWVKKTRESLTNDNWFGTEWVCDRLTPYMDFTHGCGFGTRYSEDSYPYMFHYVFPEAQISNRFIHDERAGFKSILNYDFAVGLIYDVSFYRGRAEGMDDFPEYSNHVKFLCSLREKYRPFFTDGKFDIVEEVLPRKVFATKYTLDGKSIVAAWNGSPEPVTVAGKELASGEVTVIEL